LRSCGIEGGLASALFKEELAKKLGIVVGGCKAGLLLFRLAWELELSAWPVLLLGGSISFFSGSFK